MKTLSSIQDLRAGDALSEDDLVLAVKFVSAIDVDDLMTRLHALGMTLLPASNGQGGLAWWIVRHYRHDVP